MSGGLYHELQVRMTYHSIHIEGSRLSEDQTRLIFETNTIDIGKGIPVDDIIETVNHFRAIDFCIDMVEEPLSLKSSCKTLFGEFFDAADRGGLGRKLFENEYNTK